MQLLKRFAETRTPPGLEVRLAQRLRFAFAEEMGARVPAPPAWRVVPRCAFVLEGAREIPDAPLPALLKGYLRLGAQVCGAPAWDGDFHTADLLTMLPLPQTNPRYVERLLRAA